MIIQDIYDLEIFIDDLNIFDTSAASFVRADIFESISNPIPTCNLEVFLPIDFIDKRSIVDGTLIKFHISSKTLKLDEEYKFRLFNIKELELQHKYMHVILEGVIDFYNGYSGANKYNMYATTSNVFQKIASDYNLTSDIDSTNDAQLWVAGQNTIYQYMNILAQKGWINETSGMFWCFDRQKRLLYKNLTTLFRERQEKIYTFVQTPTPNLQNKEFGYTFAKASLQSGTNNLRNEGYGGTDYYFDLLTYGPKEAFSKKVVAESKIINISKELSQGLDEEFLPFDVGNFNPNYYNAIKQNRRILSTYSSYVTLESQFFQPYRLAQIVNLSLIDAQYQDAQVKALSGTYMIDAIHLDISLKAITSMVEIVMQGLNGKALTREVY